MTDTRSEINRYFTRSGIALTPRQQGQFARYLELILEHNDSLDLTRMSSFEDIAIKHFIDSIYFTEFVELPSPLLDIGSGAGFPGIPLKIYLQELALTLAEPRKKRAAFLELAVRELGLTGVEVYPHMVTGLSDFTVSGAITRALEPVDETLTRVAHFLHRGGRVVFMKGPAAGDDVAGLSGENRTAYSLETDRGYTLPHTRYERRIIVYRKESETMVKTYAILKDLTATTGTAVTSAENKRYKSLKKIADGSGRKSGMVIVSGKKIVAELIQKNGSSFGELVLCDGYAENDESINAAINECAARGSATVLKKSLFNELDRFDTGGPLLVFEAPAMKEWDFTAAPGCTLLIPFQDPANVGSAIRSAVGFGVRRIVMMKEAASPYHPKSIRSSAGAVFSTELLKGPSLYDLEGLIGEDTDIVALDMNGEPLPSFRFPDRFLLLPGIEGPGLPDSFRPRSVSIPLDDRVESLNASAALSIALYEWSRHSPSN